MSTYAAGRSRPNDGLASGNGPTNDQEALDETGIRALRRKPVFTTPDVFPPAIPPHRRDRRRDRRRRPTRRTTEPQHCYVCKQRYPRSTRSTTSCARAAPAFNFAKRTETADLSGRVALLTGGRVKIGYQAGIKLLRAGAHLIVSTRFPRDAAKRYAAEPDFDELGRSARDLRPRPPPHTERRGLLPTSARRRTIDSTSSSTTPARPFVGRPTSTGT